MRPNLLVLIAVCFAPFARPDQTQLLSFDSALILAELRAPALAAQSAGVAAAQSAAIPAAALPNPKLLLGVENVPTSGADRGSVGRDFMTMEKIGVMQEVPNGAKRRARAEAAAAATAGAIAQQRIERLQVRAQTAQAWLQRFYLEQRLALLDALERENELLESSARAQLAGAQNTAGPALQAQQEAAAIADRRDELQRDIEQAKALLKRWIGDDAYLPLTGAAPAFTIDATVLQQHLHRHPELAAFGPMTAQANAELRAAEAEKTPDWAVEFAYQRRGAPYTDMVSLQFTFDLPVFNGSRQNPRIEARRQELLRLDYQREALLRDHTGELESDLAAATALARQLTRLQQVRIPLAQRQADVQLAAYRSGSGTLDAVLAARRELIEMQLRRLDLEQQQAALAARLNFAYAEEAQ